MIADDLGGEGAVEVRLDGVVLAFTAVVSVLAALAFGSIPLLRPGPLAATLHESGRGRTVTRARHRTRHVLMAGQVALALLLWLVWWTWPRDKDGKR